MTEVHTEQDAWSQPLLDLVDREWRDLCEKDDRNSPAEYPDMCLISYAEFNAAICEGYLLARPREDALEAQVSDLQAENERLREALTKADAFLTDYFSPWGSWKTEWWEDVSGDLPFGDHNALKVLEKAIRAALKGPNHD